MENPANHKQWSIAIQKALKDPEKTESVQKVLDDVKNERSERSKGYCGSSLLSEQYHALVEEGLI